MVDLSGKVAIVTGGAVRLGKAMATALAGKGVRVVVHYNTSSTEAQATVAEIRAAGGDAIAAQADLSDLHQIPDVVDVALEAFGKADILVNSAALFEPGDIQGTTPENWDRQFAVNLRAPFFLSKEFAKRAVRDRGQIINIAGTRAVKPDPNHLAYSVTKAGVVALTRALALALAPKIRVNAIAPGAILPPPGMGEEYLEQVARQTPAQKPGSPDDIVRALLFLLESPFVTGHVMTVDGGASL
jgi:pteridine reductase